MRSTPRVLLLAAILCSPRLGLPQQPPSITTTLELEKAIYASNESVRFWIGVSSRDPIPDALQQSGVVHFLWPDGRKVDEHVGWPIDGDPSHGWSGGWGFGTKQPDAGRYVISFEFAGRKTEDRILDIVPNPFPRSLDTRWVFNDAGPVGQRAAVLHVENKSDRVLRFAPPGLSGSEVWMDLERQPSLRDSRFILASAILPVTPVPDFSMDRFNWSNQSKWPMVILHRGVSAARTILLQSAYPFQSGQEYEVTFSTALTVFLGEPNDPDAALFPLRIPVTGTSHFRW